jgi:hypothetical protein
MVYYGEDPAVIKNAQIIWEQVRSLEEKPIYPAIMRRVLITAHEEEYIDHDLEYDEKYSEWLELREGFIVGNIEQKSNLLGIGDAIILDIGKHVLMRTPRVTRCGLVLPMVSYQGHTSQPMDYLTYFENMIAWIEAYKNSEIKKSLRC